jgi:bla regulator protein BlaR1
MIAALTNHLWQSTLFGLAVSLLTLAFRNSRAQVRFWLWFSASLKFLLPFSLLLNLGSHLAWTPAAPAEAPHAGSVAMLQIAEPLPESLPLTAPPPVRRSRIPILALSIWACGFLYVVLIRFRDYRQIRGAVRASRQVQLSVPVEVRSSPGVLEPGVFGLFRPVLLLPADIMKRLTPAQFDAVVAHEICHIRRRDNLTASIHMSVEALFWFHPMLWWIGARMIEERERACDEAVLSLGSEPREYAEGILSVCKSYLESPLRSFSGVTGSDLKKRVHAILTGRIAGELSSAKKALLAFVATLALSAPLIVGAIDAPLIRAQSASRPQFEVASIKRCAADAVAPGGRGGAPPSFSPGRMTLNCPTVRDLIDAAYVMYADGRNPNRLKLQRIPIEGGPGWIDSERYTINAKAEGNANAYEMQGALLQTLLENRFKLKIHRETREIPVYDLVVAKGGPKLKPFQEGSCTPTPPIDLTNLAATLPSRWPPLPPGQRYCIVGGGAAGPNFAANMQGVSLDEFANFLSSGPRPVVNKTGIKGVFEIRLEFGLDDDARQRLTQITGNDPGEPTAPPVFTAIQEQLGLKLESAKGPGEFLVIDHVERPDEN